MESEKTEISRNIPNGDLVTNDCLKKYVWENLKIGYKDKDIPNRQVTQLWKAWILTIQIIVSLRLF